MGYGLAALDYVDSAVDKFHTGFLAGLKLFQAGKGPLRYLP